jgi:hypothetical protein
MCFVYDQQLRFRILSQPVPFRLVGVYSCVCDTQIPEQFFVLLFQFPTMNQNKNIAFRVLGHGGEDIRFSCTAWRNDKNTLTVPECFPGGFVQGLLVISKLNLIHLLCGTLRNRAEHQCSAPFQYNKLDF